MSNNGIRSHHALNTAIVACMRPTFERAAAAIARPVTFA
jgi:hypothetical protein